MKVDDLEKIINNAFENKQNTSTYIMGFYLV